LNVGSNLPRKNRAGVINIFARVRERWPEIELVFVGENLSEELRGLARREGVFSSIRELGRLSDEELNAVYNRAFAFLFPTRFEGFGWPVIEAQAAGCPVVCSNATSLPEVAGDGALTRPPDDEAGFSNDILNLRDSQFREALIRRGLNNLQRFAIGTMVENYEQQFAALTSHPAAVPNA
jgi:glycosyltransferase involved in cell wall biosynthesis